LNALAEGQSPQSAAASRALEDLSLFIMQIAQNPQLSNTLVRCAEKSLDAPLGHIYVVNFKKELGSGIQASKLLKVIEKMQDDFMNAEESTTFFLRGDFSSLQGCEESKMLMDTCFLADDNRTNTPPYVVPASFACLFRGQSFLNDFEGYSRQPLQDQECATDERGFSFFNTRKFSIGNNDFGSKNLFLYDIVPELQEIDGLLGMDFLKNHVVYIDYKSRTVYIQDNKVSAKPVL
jgi:hypothetical protein